MEHIERHDNGNVRTRSTLEDGKLHGEVLTYNEEEQLVHKASYDHGVLEGDSISYDPSGSGREIQRAAFKKGVLDGDTVGYEESGKVSSRTSFHAGKLHGETRVYIDGKLRTQIMFADGKQNGPFVSFDEEGNEIFRAFYINGKLEGESVSTDGKGKTYRRMHYRDNKLHGTSTEYHGNGAVLETATYKDGKKEGECLLFYDDGKLRSKAYYKAGELRGDPIEYDEKGNLKSPDDKPGAKRNSVFSKVAGRLTKGG